VSHEFGLLDEIIIPLVIGGAPGLLASIVQHS
jgi:hypothetical protein